MSDMVCVYGMVSQVNSDLNKSDNLPESMDFELQCCVSL